MTGELVPSAILPMIIWVIYIIPRIVPPKELQKHKKGLTPPEGLESNSIHNLGGFDFSVSLTSIPYAMYYIMSKNLLR